MSFNIFNRLILLSNKLDKFSKVRQTWLVCICAKCDLWGMQGKIFCLCASLEGLGNRIEEGLYVKERSN